MPRFRKLKLGDEKEIKKLLKQLTSSKINFNIKLILKDKNCNCLVIEDRGRVIGFGSLVLNIVPCRGYLAKIEDVIVDEKYRGQGLGKKLMQELIKISRKKKIKIVNLTSHPKRVEARKLYKSLGFKLLETDMFKLEL
jgi:ribosomal protein S18 acetylase RimI-like enzyme